MTTSSHATSFTHGATRSLSSSSRGVAPSWWFSTCVSQSSLATGKDIRIHARPHPIVTFLGPMRFHLSMHVTRRLWLSSVAVDVLLAHDSREVGRPSESFTQAPVLELADPGQDCGVSSRWCKNIITTTTSLIIRRWPDLAMISR